ncbi:hypothetical protein FIV41_20440 [Pseudomonas marginalis]|uniref:Uncharacterized protein n=1 Tax=Pseudomonas marginalis TaxID=298 RepID=A0A9X9BPJ6_PSEMA|nr:hypothetical protein [Pseudomonas marginalis]TWR56161.1 hypothetical protein FIV41_20440 [Pseudomonas marginalis]SEB61931.1 hypothetical protein SAMN04490193_1780 [Pseudomonas marginalis]
MDTISYPIQVTGDLLGLPFPTSIESLIEQGPEFLTLAFRACGALSEDNRVTAINTPQEFFAGGMGRKLLLSVQYENPSDELHTELFLKFPRDFGDPLRELFSPLMEPEIRFALLSRKPGFPVAVPKCYFADYHAASSSGLLVTEKIRFGQDGIEPGYEKCQDYELPDPLAHYKALTQALAKISSAHKAGRLDVDVDLNYTLDIQSASAMNRIPYTPSELEAKLDYLRSFIDRVPQLFPDTLRCKAFLMRFSQQVPLFLEHEDAIRAFLHSSSDYVALCHWNANVDNAWFWKSDQGTLQAGLLDWGSVGQMNIAQALFGMICAAETEFLNAHKQELLHLFVEEYQRNGGPTLDVDTLALHLKLAIATLGIAWMLDAPALIEAQIPEIETILSRHDPRLKNDFLARAQLHLLIVFLNEWQTGNFGELIPQCLSIQDHNV